MPSHSGVSNDVHSGPDRRVHRRPPNLGLYLGKVCPGITSGGGSGNYAISLAPGHLNELQACGGG